MARQISDVLTEKSCLAAFLSVMLLAGLVLIYAVPPFGGFDEPFHWFRSLQVSRGVLLAPRLGDNDWGGAIDQHGVTYAYWFAEKFERGKPIVKADSRSMAQALAATTPQHKVVSFPSTASFAPTAYMPAAVAVFIARQFRRNPFIQTVYGRVAQLAMFCTLIGVAIWLLPSGRMAVLALATAPTVLHLATCFSADPVNIAVDLVFIAWCLRLHSYPATAFGFWQRTGMLWLTAVIGTLKPTYVPLVLLLVLIPPQHFRTSQGRWMFAATGMLLCLAIAAAWSGWYHFIPGIYWHSGANPAAALAFIADHPRATLGGMIHVITDNAAFYWRDATIRFGGHPAPFSFWAPAPLAWLELFGIASLAILSGNGERNWGGKNWHVAALCCVIALCITFLLLLSFRITYGPPDVSLVQGLQGRYFMPALLLLTLGVIYATPLSLPKARMPIFAVVFCVHLAVIACATRQYALLWQ